MAPRIFVSIVTFESIKFVDRCIDSLLSSEGFQSGENLQIVVWDNNSQDGTADHVESRWKEQVVLERSPFNIGFSGGHNAVAWRFLQGSDDYLLVLNPDVRVSERALSALCTAISSGESIGAATPLLLRGDDELQPVEPAVIDAAGMVLTHSLRHFDRGSEELREEKYQKNEFVFGGTGACLMVSRNCVENVSFDGLLYEEDLFRVYPELKDGKENRVQLFDEAFFAYREDADLAWRMQRLGWKCVFVPDATAVHRRVVLPAKRRELSAALNCLGVRNRFLLQLNNFSLFDSLRAFWGGVVFRNLLVVAGVLFQERSSLRAFRELFLLARRARERFRLIDRRSDRQHDASRWFLHEGVEVES